jgi:hypothetical protein
MERYRGHLLELMRQFVQLAMPFLGIAIVQEFVDPLYQSAAFGNAFRHD